MWFTVLGPVRVTVADTAVVIDRAQRRAGLAYLLLHVGKPVYTAQLVEALWGGSPPTTAVAQVQMAVSVIRRVLRAHGGHAVSTDSGSYMAHATKQELQAGRNTVRATFC